MDMQVVKWEYVTVPIKPYESIKDILNLYGELGWELIQVDSDKAYLKRRKE